eukprot:4782278-Amphidinium_carterae.1
MFCLGGATSAPTTTTTTTTTTALVLSGKVGGLQVEYYYLTSTPKTVAVLDGLPADLTRVEDGINYESTRDAWHELTTADKFGAKWCGG